MHENADRVENRAVENRAGGKRAGAKRAGGKRAGGKRAVGKHAGRSGPAPRGRRCAFLVAAGPHDLEVDDDLARAPLEALGWSLETVAWNRAGSWDRFDLVVVRSAWDYYRHVRTFEAALNRIHQSGTVLANPLPIMRWNLRKTYLLDLEARGVPVVPTRAVDALEPGSLAALRDEIVDELGIAGSGLDGSGLGDSSDGAPGITELVVKPVVGANGDAVYRVSDDASARAAEAALRDRPALIQPFLPAVLTAGEVSLIYIGGKLSHGLRKRPRAGEFRTQEERGAAIAPFEPDPALRELADRALAAVDGPTLYARIDLIPDTGGAWRLVELELVEPSLYLRMDPGAPSRFARAIDGWPRPSG